ncbi:MAG TPA: AraC family transcriptional regulator, partial [Magnetospirillum sp.]|nr:AraC family transcriptional regulator [Magnetospirillum sp.]
MGDQAPDRALIGAAAIIEATVSQDLRRVPIFEHCLVIVREGAKDLIADDGTLARLVPGDVVLLPAGGQPTIGNRPDPALGRYVAQVLTLGPQAVAAFRQHYPLLAAASPPVAVAWHLCPGDRALADSVMHAVHGVDDPALSERMACHRCVEVLAALAERGIHLPPEAAPTAAVQVRQLVAARPHLPWSAADAARALGVSEPTLRRRLAAEATSFRHIVAEVRLTHGLMLLQTSRAPILQVALDCGYES